MSYYRAGKMRYGDSDKRKGLHGGIMNGGEERMYMNIATGSVAAKELWDYEDDGGTAVNAVERGEVVEVCKASNGAWVAV